MSETTKILYGCLCVVVSLGAVLFVQEMMMEYMKRRLDEITAAVLNIYCMLKFPDEKEDKDE